MMSDLCATCHKTHPWPDGTMPRHPFNSGHLAGVQALVQPPPSPSPPRQSSMPFDPVLRQALIDKGVLTPQDLVDALNKIVAVTSTVLGGSDVKDA